MILTQDVFKINTIKLDLLMIKILAFAIKLTKILLKQNSILVLRMKNIF
jgi:hypothetical protein